MKAGDSSACSQYAREKEEEESVPCSKRCLWSCPACRYRYLPVGYKGIHAHIFGISSDQTIMKP